MSRDRITNNCKRARRLNPVAAGKRPLRWVTRLARFMFLFVVGVFVCCLTVGKSEAQGRFELNRPSPFPENFDARSLPLPRPSERVLDSTERNEQSDGRTGLSHGVPANNGPLTPLNLQRDQSVNGKLNSDAPQQFVISPFGQPSDIQIDVESGKISLIAKGAPLRDIVTLLAEKHGMNLVMAQDAAVPISITLPKCP